MDVSNDHDEEGSTLTGENDDVGVDQEGAYTDVLDSATVDQDEDKNDSAAVLAMEAVLLKAHKALLAKSKIPRKETTQNEFTQKRKPTVEAVANAGETSAEAISKPPKKAKCERSSRRWSNEDTSLLIDMLEERPCLWDTGSKDYQSRDKRAKAIEDMQDVIGLSPNEIKLKITSLRGQLGRELAKVSKAKSGQSVDDCYKSTWIFWERLQFLRPVMQPGKSRDSMQSSSENSPEPPLEITVDLEESSSTSTPSSQKSSKSSVEAKKHELLATCINVLKEPVSKPKGKEDHFALYVAQKLDGFDSRKRAVAEKRITDITFDLEINGLSPM